MRRLSAIRIGLQCLSLVLVLAFSTGTTSGEGVTPALSADPQRYTLRGTVLAPEAVPAAGVTVLRVPSEGYVVLVDHRPPEGPAEWRTKSGVTTATTDAAGRVCVEIVSQGVWLVGPQMPVALGPTRGTSGVAGAVVPGGRKEVNLGGTVRAVVGRFVLRGWDDAIGKEVWAGKTFFSESMEERPITPYDTGEWVLTNADERMRETVPAATSGNATGLASPQLTRRSSPAASWVTTPGDYVAEAYDEGEAWTLLVKRTEDGKALPETLRLPADTTVAWDPRGGGFWYGRHAGEGHAAGVYYHELDTDQAADTPVFDDQVTRPASTGGGASESGAVDLLYRPFASEDGRYLLIEMHHGTGNGVRVREICCDARLYGYFQELVPSGVARHTVLGNVDETIYLLTDRDAPRGSIIAIDPKRPRPSDWHETVAEDASATLTHAALLDGVLRLTYRDTDGRETVRSVGLSE